MKKPEIRPIIAACIALAILAVILAVAVVNQRVVSARLASQVAAQRRQLSELTKDTASRRALATNYQQLSTQIGGRFRGVSWDKQMPKMVNQLTGIMNAHGIEIETLKPETITSADNISRLPLRVSLKSGLGDLARALRDIQRATPLMDIEQISIRVANANTNTLQADVTVSSFAVVDKSAPSDKPQVSITPLADGEARGGAL